MSPEVLLQISQEHQSELRADGLWRSIVKSVRRRAVTGQISADKAATVARGTGARV